MQPKAHALVSGHHGDRTCLDFVRNFGLGDIFLSFFNISLQKFKPKLLADLTQAGGHFFLGIVRNLWSQEWRILWTVQPLSTRRTLSLVRSGDVYPLPGPNRQTNSAMLDIPKELKSNIKVAFLNVRSLKSRVHFCLVKETILQNKFDILTISETWTDLTVSDASLEISGYQFFRQDRGSQKSWGGLCIYAKSNLKITVLDDLLLACEDGFQQLWLIVQCRSHHSFLVCNTYRPPDTPTSCFENLGKRFVDALLIDLDIIILGDLNCNLLACSLETESLREFISTFQLKPAGWETYKDYWDHYIPHWCHYDYK